MSLRNFGVITACWLVPFLSLGQQKRLVDHNSIGWFVYNGDHKLSKKWSLHTEYQWRRIHYIRTWQQSLARLGANYKLTDKVKLGGGYTYFVTFPYGEHPVADQGVPTPEHRLYQDIQLADTLGRLTLSHRFRFEERWLSQLAETGSRRISGWAYENRIRYQITANFPLQGVSIDDNEFYLTFFDELFISFGRNAGVNIFNQNRILGGLGYQFRDNFSLELGYLNQITQHAETDPVSGNPVFEFNNGFRLNVVFGF
ncbi:DUF2490 domain-containing protein [Larkinella knui]|uniref:DUF2490 domain-containing protein n=1 Tax=Larkinella knui TaxID=2025310 RepID=A0A3P1CV80_9BACT|nr:DUF2490 domain-containing protein [Larkinella knui]RRB17046.1 DUF2490 domain-containing protein [Larkinella knui]